MFFVNIKQYFHYVIYDYIIVYILYTRTKSVCAWITTQQYYYTLQTHSQSTEYV